MYVANKLGLEFNHFLFLNLNKCKMVVKYPFKALPDFPYFQIQPLMGKKSQDCDVATIAI